MVQTGVQTPQLPQSTDVDGLIGNKDGNTVRIGFDTLAARVGANLGPTYETLAEIDADLSWAEGSLGTVWGDADDANKGVYKKSGLSGAGSWTRIQDLPLNALTSEVMAARDQADSSANTATTEAANASIAALVAGAPIYADTTAGIAATTNGDIFFVPDAGILKLYENQSSVAVLQVTTPITNRRKVYDSVALGADATLTYTAGEIGTVVDDDIIESLVEGFRWKVAASGASDHHLTTAGGVKLYVLKGELGYNVKAFWRIGDADDTAAIARACTAAQGGNLVFQDGNYVNTAIPSGIDGVHCIGTPRVSFTGTAIPMFNGVYTGNKEVALLAGVIRYYSSGSEGAGWYFLADQGDNHEPILLSPVSTSGSGSLILDINIGDLGFDPALWTPSGVVCGADDVFAQEGVTFGASVGSTTLQIYGSYNTPYNSLVKYTGAAWDSDGYYTPVWDVTDSFLRLTTNTSLRKQAWLSSKVPIITNRVGVNGPFFRAIVSNSGDHFVDITFWDDSNAKITAESTLLQFNIFDPVRKNAGFKWNADTGSSANIWLIGTFTRKSASY